MSEAGSETPKLASRDATLANTLRPSAKIATSKPHGGGDGPRLAGVVDRRPLQLRVAVVISETHCLLGCLGAVGTPLPQPIAPPNRTNLANWRFWACWARRASGVLVPPPSAEEQTPWRFLQAARPSPGPSDGDENTALRPRAEGDAGAAVTRVSTHDTRLFVGFAI